MAERYASELVVLFFAKRLTTVVRLAQSRSGTGRLRPLPLCKSADSDVDPADCHAAERSPALGLSRLDAQGRPEPESITAWSSHFFVDKETMRPRSRAETEQQIRDRQPEEEELAILP